MVFNYVTGLIVSDLWSMHIFYFIDLIVLIKMSSWPVIWLVLSADIYMVKLQLLLLFAFLSYNCCFTVLVIFMHICLLVIGLYVGFLCVSDFFCLTVLSPVDKATNPLNRETDWESIQLFCDQLSNEPEGCVNKSILNSFLNLNVHSKDPFTQNVFLHFTVLIYIVFLM